MINFIRKSINYIKAFWKRNKPTIVLIIVNIFIWGFVLLFQTGCGRLSNVTIDQTLPSAPTCSPCEMSIPAPVSLLSQTVSFYGTQSAYGTKYSPMPLVSKKLFVMLA